MPIRYKQNEWEILLKYVILPVRKVMAGGHVPPSSAFETYWNYMSRLNFLKIKVGTLFGAG